MQVGGVLSLQRAVGPAGEGVNGAEMRARSVVNVLDLGTLFPRCLVQELYIDGRKIDLGNRRMDRLSPSAARSESWPVIPGSVLGRVGNSKLNCLWLMGAIG